jgi:hypothetical protein
MNANAMQSAADSVQAQRAEFYRRIGSNNLSRRRTHHDAPWRLHHHAVVDLA